MKKILVPVDYSDFSFSSVATSIILAAHLEGEVRLLHVFDDPFVESNLDASQIKNEVSNYTERLLHKMEKDAHDQMANLLREVERFQMEQNFHVPVSVDIQRGFVVDKIVSASRLWMAQLIVMGSRGHSKLGRSLFGTVTKGVVRASHCAVLTLPANYVWKAPRNVLYATDFNEYDDIAISRLLNLMTPFHVTLFVTHFGQANPLVDKKHLLELENKLRADNKIDHLRYEVVDSKFIMETFDAYVESNKIDLVALTTRKLSLLQRIFHSSTAIDLLYHSEKPVIVFHEK
jgi:nucleotide-binding universal stress UspA family protein